MSSRSRFLAITGAAVIALVASLSLGPALASGGSSEVPTTGHPSSPFPQNKQNEPAIAVDLNPNDYNTSQTQRILIAGANDEIDLQPCYKTGNPSTGYPTGNCPFTPGVGVSGVYFSTNGGATWTQPTYAGYSARSTVTNIACTTPTCPKPQVEPGANGSIGTVPGYYESGLVSGGDPGLAIGPKPGSVFSWSNGSRFYYSNLTSNFPGSATLTVQEGLAVSHFDWSGSIPSQSEWSTPSIASGRQNPVLFDDKPAIWVDNAASSPFFGRVYVTWTAFRAANAPNPFEPEPIMSAFSTDGGVTWSNPVQLSPAADSPSYGRQGSTIRTDSHGNIYVAWEGFTQTTGPVQMLSISRNGGHTFSTPRPVALVRDVGVLDPIQGRLLFDGVQGSRTDSFPSLDIANGAPTGTGAVNRIVLAWSDNGKGTGDSDITSPSRAGSEESLLITSIDGGMNWNSVGKVSAAGDRPDFSAIAISPDGTAVYLTYDAFLQDYQIDSTSPPRNMQGVVRSATVSGGAIGKFGNLFRGAVGDARGSSQNNLLLEFLGDYNYIVADNSGPFAVFNDAQNEADCATVDTYRANWEAAVAAGTTPPPEPFVLDSTVCPNQTFGNLNIYD